MRWKLKLNTDVKLFVLGITSVLPTLFGTFIFDDSEAILNNEDVNCKSKCGCDKHLGQIFFNDFWGTRINHTTSHKSYRPFTTLTYRLEFCLWGQNPFPFHLINCVLHGINCILVFYFLLTCFNFQKLSSRKWKLSQMDDNVIFWASVLFSVHPIHVEPLGSLVGRADLLSSMIFLSGFILVVSFTDSSTIYPFVLIPAISILGSLFKENCVMLVIFYLSLRMLHWRSLELSYRQIAYSILAMLATSFFILWRLWFQGGSPVFQNSDNPPAFAMSWFSKVVSIVYVWILNMWILLNPTWLCFDWSMGCISLIESLRDPRFSLVLVCIIVGALAFFKALKSRTLTVGILVGLSTFLPSSNLIFAVGFVIAERNLYLPSIGFCLIVSYALLKYQKRKVMPTLIAFLFFLRSIQRSLDWIESGRLFQSALNVCPNNAKVHYNLGAVHAESGKTELAIKSYTLAIELKQDYYQAMNNLGNVLRSNGQLGEAELWLRKAVNTKNDFAAAWMNLGIVLSKKNAAEAMECYNNALKYRRFYPDCEYNIGNLYLDAKNFSSALKSWIRVTSLQPSHLQSWLNIIILLEQEHRLVEAKKYGHLALDAIGHEDHSLQFLMGNIYGRLEDYESAKKYFLNAINQCTEKQLLAKYWSNLGVLYHRWNKFDEAHDCYAKALKLQPDLGTARINLERLAKIKTK